MCVCGKRFVIIACAICDDIGGSETEKGMISSQGTRDN
jgi:hypothetical protein